MPWRSLPEYDIWHMMIDVARQGKGYGTEALRSVLEFIRTKPVSSNVGRFSAHGDTKKLLTIGFRVN